MSFFVNIFKGISGDELSSRKETGPEIKIFTSTFNLGNASIDKPECIFPVDGGDHDIVAFACQESDYHVSYNNFLSNLFIDTCTADLKDNVLKVLGSSYSLLTANKLGTIRLLLFVKDTIARYTSVMSVQSDGTGFLGIFPNKGGIETTIKVFGSVFTFVSCHLTPHEGAERCHMRNAGVSEILGGIRESSTSRGLDVNLSHHIFFMGDMNYRLTFDTDSFNEKGDKTLSFCVLLRL
jgi:phosphatidylinositol-bisphosphatase